MVPKHLGFSELVKDPNWVKNCLCTVINEAHRFVECGKTVRLQYGEMETIRSFLGGGRPFLFVTATSPPAIFDKTIQPCLQGGAI